MTNFILENFRKSTFSSGEDPQCVYAAVLVNVPTVEIRDSKRGLDESGLTVSRAAFGTFVGSIS